MKAKELVALITAAQEDAAAKGNPDPDVKLLTEEGRLVNFRPPFHDSMGNWTPVSYGGEEESGDYVLIDTGIVLI